MSTAAATRPAVEPKSPEAPWTGLYQPLSREHGFEPLRIEGRLPEDLVGTLYRNGPSQFESFGERYQHLFDGDGGVSAVRFGGGQALGAARLVQSEGLLEERRAGRRLYGGYGTSTPRFRRRAQALKNAANTSVMIWQDRLYALVESSAPVELSVDDLSTLGERDLDGAVSTRMTAHPHRVPARKASYSYGMQYGRFTELEIHELPDQGQARRLTTVRLSGATMIHDFIATDRHLIFFAPPLRLQLFKTLLGLGSFGENLAWKPEEGTEVIVVPIDAPSEVVRFTTEPFYQWHFANAFERAGQLVVDFVELPDFSSNQQFGQVLRGGRLSLGSKLTRAVIDPKAKTLTRQTILERECEFPRVPSGQLAAEHEVVYVADSAGPSFGWFDGVSAISTRTGQLTRFGFGPGQFVSEPVFVRRPGSATATAGHLLTLVYDAATGTSHVAVLDAERLEEGPVARAHFDHAIPVTFHGNFARAR